MTPPSQQDPLAAEATQKGQGSNLADRFLISLGFKSDPRLIFLEDQRNQLYSLFSTKPSVDLDGIQIYDRIADISRSLATQRDTKAKNRLAVVGLMLSLGTFFVGYENMRMNKLSLATQSRRDRPTSQILKPKEVSRKILITIDNAKTDGKTTLEISLD